MSGAPEATVTTPSAAEEGTEGTTPTAPHPGPALPSSMDELMACPGVGWPETKPEREAHMHGWFLATHKRVFRQLLSRETRIIIELGSWYGASTAYFASECPGANIYAVDLWDDNFIIQEQGDHYVDQSLKDMLGANPLYETFLVNLWEYKDRVVPMRMTTLQGLRMLHAAGVKPDIIYIDADHHYDAVRADIKLSLELFPDAVLVGDDFGNYEDVSRAVKELSGEYLKPLHVDANHCWTYSAITSSMGMTHKPIPTTTKDTSFKSLLSVFQRGVDTHKQQQEEKGGRYGDHDRDSRRRDRSRSRDRGRERDRSRDRKRRSRSRERGSRDGGDRRRDGDGRRRSRSRTPPRK